MAWKYEMLLLLLSTSTTVVSCYELSMRDDKIHDLNEEYSRTTQIFLSSCDGFTQPINVSLTRTSGRKESLEYPDVIHNVPCCPGSQLSNDALSCGANVTLHGKMVGFVSLKFCDQANASRCVDLEIGVLGPPASWKDTVFLYGVIVGSVINTLFFGITLDLIKVKNYLKRPVAPVIGLSCQFVIMPLIGFALTQILNRDPALEFGIFAAAVAPGGGASNAWSYLLGGDVDLSITMTFLSTIAALGFIPLWMYTLGAYLLQDAKIIIPYAEIAKPLAYIVGPLIVGLVINKFLPRKYVKYVLTSQKIFVATFVLFIIVFAIYANIYLLRMVFTDYELALGSMLLPYVGGLCGLLVALALKRDKSVAITIGIETTIQNTTIAVYILRTALPPPWSNISSAVPLCVALFTPWPLNILGITRLVYLKCCKKEDSKSADDSLSTTDECPKISTEEVGLGSMKPSKDGTYTNKISEL